MAGFRIRTDFDSLSQVGRAFDQQAQAATQALQKINQQVDVLRSGDWAGKGAKQFYDDMDNLLLPSLTKLVKALESGQHAMQNVSQIMHNADDELGGLFRGQPEAGIMAALRGGIAAAEAAAAAGGAAGGGSSAGSSAGPQLSNPFLVLDPSQLFAAASMQNLIGIEIQGAGPELGQLMGSLSQAPAGGDVTSILIEISDLRGRPFVEIQVEYDKYLEIQVQQDAAAAPTDTAEAAQPEPEAAAGGGGGSGQGFQGSMTQMRFGKVVGDAYGIDPVFGAMLKPNGGLIGPGKFAVAGGNTPVGYHAVAQSAAGYLLNSHNLGPGYNYSGLGQSSTPQAGHLGGIGYWRGATGGSSSVGGSPAWSPGSVSGSINMASSIIRGSQVRFLGEEHHERRRTGHARIRLPPGRGPSRGRHRPGRCRSVSYQPQEAGSDLRPGAGGSGEEWLAQTAGCSPERV